MANIFDELTAVSQNILDSAVSLAIGNKNPQVVPLHILWALSLDSGSVLNQILNKNSISKDALVLDIKSSANNLPQSSNVSKNNCFFVQL